MHTSRHFTRLILTALVALAAGTSSLRAANYYWDINGTDATDIDSPSGTWDGLTNVWNSSSNGAAAGVFTNVLGATNTATFSSLNTATNAYTVTVTGTQFVEGVFVEDGIVTLTNGTIKLARSTASGSDSRSQIRTSTFAGGTTTIFSEILVENTNTSSLLKLVAFNSPASVDLEVAGPITAMSNSAVGVRFGGNGAARIGVNLGATMTVGTVQPVLNTPFAFGGTFTLAGTQTLGTATVSLNASGTSDVTPNGKLIMGESTNDVQNWGASFINHSNGSFIINATASMAGRMEYVNGTNVTVNGSLTFTGGSNIVMTGTNALYTNRFTVSSGGRLTLKIGTTNTTGYSRFTKTSNTAFTNAVLNFDGELGFDLSTANLTQGNTWQILPTTNTVIKNFGPAFSVVNFTPDITTNEWTYTDANTNTWSFNRTNGVLTLVSAPPPAEWIGNLFWDIDGTIAGAGGAGSPSGNWNGVDTNFNVNSAGASSSGYLYATTTTNADVIFSAGSDATNAYTVTVTGTQYARTLRFQEGAPTLTGGVVSLPRSITSVASASYIGNASDTNLAGTITISSGLQVNNPTGTLALVKFVAPNGPPALDLLIDGPISVTDVTNKYGVRIFGRGDARVATPLTSGSATCADIQSFNANERLGGIWTFAGNQPLGTNTYVYFAGDCATNGAQVVFGDGTNDVQSFGLAGVDDGDLTLVVNATLTADGFTLGEGFGFPNTTSGGQVLVNGALYFSTNAGSVRVGPLAVFTLATNAEFHVTVGATSGTNHNRILAGTNGTGGTVTLDGNFLFNLSGAPTTGSNDWQIVDNANLTETYGASFAVVGFSNVTAGVWKYEAGSQKWTFDTATGVLTLVGSTAYQQWAALNGLDNSPGKESGFDVDPENDTAANGLEWVLGGGPLARDWSAIRPVESIVGTNFVFTFDRVDASEPETTLLLQWGSTLTGWNDVTVGTGNSGPNVNGVTITVTENGAGDDAVQVQVPKHNGTNGALYLRLKAIQN